MKRIINIWAIGLVISVVSSCVDDDKLFELDDFEVGALPNMQRTSNDPGYIDFQDLDQATMELMVDFVIDVPQSDDGGLTNGGDGREHTSTEFAEVSSVQLAVSYNGASSSVIESGVISEVTSWPATFTFKGVQDLIDAIPSLNSKDDIQLGDVFTFVCGVTLADGRELPAFITDASGNSLPNYSVNFAGSGNNPGFEYAISYLVTCPSDLAGNYTSTVLSSNIALSNFRTPQPVTVTGSGGSYILSDGTADIFGPDFPLGLAFSEICGEIFITPGSIEFPTLVIYDLNSATYDPVTDVITFDITYNANSCCGLPGIQYVLQIEPE